MFRIVKIVAVLSMAVATTICQAEDIIGVVTANQLNVRVQPKVAVTAVASLPRGTKVAILGQVEDWYKIRAPRTAEVWVSRSFIKESTIIKRVNLRSGPSVAFQRYTTVNPGLKVGILDSTSNPDWVRIVPPKGLPAYVSTQYIHVLSSKPAAAKKSEPSEKTVVKKKMTLPAEIGMKPKATTKKDAPAEVVKQTQTRQTVVTPPGGADKKDTSGSTADSKILNIQNQELVKEIVKSVTIQGILLPLVKNNSLATHSIAVKVENQYYPLCYVYTDRYNLSLWENRRIMVKGEQRWVKGWQKPLVKAERITPMWK